MGKYKKELKDVKWETVAVEGFPITAGDKLHSFVGLEECTDYDLDKHSKKSNRQKKSAKKRKNSTEPIIKAVPNKKVKLSNGFIVESCEIAAPSLTNDETNKNAKKMKNKGKSVSIKTQSKENVLPIDKKNKPKLGEDIGHTETELTPEDMLSWAEFKLPEPIMKGLTELGFKKPTKIQQLSLPAAIHGRRDILGAAETGSGKTLAFGLPILSGILKLKEKAAKGFDPYDLPFKKSSNKKKPKKEENLDKTGVKNNRNKRNKKPVNKPKESSEDGYSSGDDSPNETPVKIMPEKSKKLTKSKPKKLNDDDDFIQEIEVPLRKKKDQSEDEGNDSDDANYTHLSDMLDSDDLADSSSADEESSEENIKAGESDGVSEDEVEKSEESSENENDSVEESVENDSQESSGDENDLGEESVENDSGEESVENDSGGESVENDSGGELSENDEESESEEEINENELDENLQGIGCVKVIDNVEMPQPTLVKTGKPLYALILTPTRELAIQITRHLCAVAKYTGIRIATVVGGMAAVKQERVLNSGPEVHKPAHQVIHNQYNLNYTVVVATPGRLWELLSQGHPHLQQLDCIKFLAIDETDRMVERSHFEELHPLLERLNADEQRRAARQNFVFSATLTMVHDLPAHAQGKKVTKRGKIINRKVHKMTPAQKVNKLVKMIGMTEPKVVDITQDNSGTAENLTESRITCSFELKDAYLYYVLKRHPGRTIVFCNSIGCVQRLAQLLTILKCRPLPLHASMAQRQRLKNLERFRDDPKGILVATDVAARGLDIPNVDHVIHYQVPKTAENYVHRSGRTARATKEGLTILMMEPSEGYLYSKMCRTLNKTSELPLFPVPTSALAPFKDIVCVARDIDALELKRRRATQANGWREKAARDMDMIIDEDDIPVTKVDPSIEKALKAKRRQLDSLLSRPLFPKGFSFKYPTLNEPSALCWGDENALQVMKKAIQSGEIKKQKRKSKNAPLLKLEKDLQKV